MRSLGRGGPSPQSEGVPGSLGPSALPSFPAVGVLPVVLSRRGSAAALPRSRAARTSRLRRLRSRRRRPRASLPPGSGECLAAVASGTPPRPSVCPSVRPLLCTPGLLSAFSLWSPEPPCPSLSSHSSVRSQDGHPLPPSLVACFVCLLPPARPLWDFGQHHSAAWDARQCLQFESPPPRPRGRYGILEAVPPYSAVRGYRASCHLKIPASSLQTVKKTCVKEPSWRTGKSGLRAGGKVCQNAHNGCQRHPAKDPETQEILVLFQDEKEGQQREVASPLPLSAHLGWEVASTCGFPKQTNKQKATVAARTAPCPTPNIR